jgi:hypothetical protein
MNLTKIYVTFTQTLDKEPLAVLHGPLCGNCSAHTPKQLRAIAAALTKIADDAFDHPAAKRTYRNVSRAYDVKV